jgi:hypothetical protein
MDMIEKMQRAEFGGRVRAKWGVGCGSDHTVAQSRRRFICFYPVVKTIVGCVIDGFTALQSLRNWKSKFEILKIQRRNADEWTNDFNREPREMLEQTGRSSTSDQGRKYLGGGQAEGPLPTAYHLSIKSRQEKNRTRGGGWGFGPV